ncbi:class I SAM-dependent methyltransferase [Plantactinospora sp. WMMB334]|uniref:class I SAM-dependent methyltransferase n=1 Tax=Plantactinospora sp. WMMB334 TaxID=3404119 RepID=UPI003B932DAA
MRLLTGLADRLLNPVEMLPDRAHVVQLACGTGELSLTLARRRPDLRITAVDIDPAVLAVGRASAARDGLGVEFRAMSMAELDLADRSADAVVSRMGLFLPGTAPFDVAAREAGRILRPGGLISIATWSNLAGSPYTRVGLSVLRQILPEGAIPDMEVLFTEAARPGAFERHLENAGIHTIHASWFNWVTEYPDFESWWSYDTGFGPLKALFDSLDARQRDTARRLMTAEIEEHRTSSGGYGMPATARTITGQR